MPLSVAAPDLRILHVEDDEDDAFMLEEALDALPLRIRLEHKLNGHDALAWLEEHAHGDGSSTAPVDLVILDLNMPVMNGMEFLQKVRSDRRYGALNIVVMTTATSDEVLEVAREAGANAAMSKTVSIDELSDQCSSLIRKFGGSYAVPSLQN